MVGIELLGQLKRVKQQFAPPPHCHCRLGVNEMLANYVETLKQLKFWTQLIFDTAYETISQEASSMLWSPLWDKLSGDASARWLGKREVGTR